MLADHRRAFPPEPGVDGWQLLATAPLDGTIIEIGCWYGLEPWFGPHRWQDYLLAYRHDGSVVVCSTPGERGTWVSVPDESGFIDVFDRSRCRWRPLSNAAQSRIASEIRTPLRVAWRYKAGAGSSAPRLVDAS